MEEKEVKKPKIDKKVKVIDEALELKMKLFKYICQNTET